MKDITICNLPLRETFWAPAPFAPPPVLSRPPQHPWPPTPSPSVRPACCCACLWLERGAAPRRAAEIIPGVFIGARKSCYCKDIIHFWFCTQHNPALKICIRSQGHIRYLQSDPSCSIAVPWPLATSMRGQLVRPEEPERAT